MAGDRQSEFNTPKQPPNDTPPLRIEDTCFSCEAIDKYSDLAGRYVDSMSEALADPMQTLFFALAGLWVVVTGLKIIIGGQTPDCCSEGGLLHYPVFRPDAITRY